MVEFPLFPHQVIINLLFSGHVGFDLRSLIKISGTL